MDDSIDLDRKVDGKQFTTNETDIAEAKGIFRYSCFAPVILIVLGFLVCKIFKIYISSTL